MAPEKKEKKRKAAPAATIAPADPPAKKSKKVFAVEKSADPAPKSILKKKSTGESNGVSDLSSLKVNGEPTRKAKPRKRASDFLSDNDDVSEVEETNTAETVKLSKKQSKESKKDGKQATKKIKKVEVTEEPADASEAEHSDDDGSEDEIDDQTAELIKGFESSGDEDASEDEGLEDGKPVPRIPDSKKTKRKIQKKLKDNDEPEEPGTVYVGRIPHGFYEHQMRAYFTQFGDITRLRLSRNRVTGRSKHYAFIEFASATVAKIVAETMNNYLMYGHILKCKYVPREQQHPELWKGANRRFKLVPWNKIDKEHLERGKTREKWTKKIQQEEKRRLAKAEKLKALGYEFEMPKLTSVDQVPVQKAPAAIEDGSDAVSKEAEIVAASDGAGETVEGTPKKSEKAKKKKEVENTSTPKTTTSTEKATPSSEKSSAKKSKKSPGKTKKIKA